MPLERRTYRFTFGPSHKYVRFAHVKIIKYLRHFHKLNVPNHNVSPEHRTISFVYVLVNIVMVAFFHVFIYSSFTVT